MTYKVVMMSSNAEKWHQANKEEKNLFKINNI
jgi:hypothetical protein